MCGQSQSVEEAGGCAEDAHPKAITLHPRFLRNSYANDIALVELAMPARCALSDPSAVALLDGDSRVGDSSIVTDGALVSEQIATVAGWGHVYAPREVSAPRTTPHSSTHGNTAMPAWYFFI